MSPTVKSYSFRSCVRACERAGEARRSCVGVRGVVSSEARVRAVELCSGPWGRGVAWRVLGLPGARDLTLAHFWCLSCAYRSSVHRLG